LVTLTFPEGRAAEFYEAVQDSAMEQLIDFPTHLKGNILDLVITNIPERVEEVCEAGSLGKSDHSILLVSIRHGCPSTETRPVPDWRRANWSEMRAELKSDRRWLMQLRASRTDEAWNILRDKVTYLTEKHVPVRKARKNNRPAWMTQEILREIRRKKRLWKKTKNNQPSDEYLAVEKKVRNLIRNSKRRFEKKLASGNEGNKRPFFAYIKQRTQSRPSIGPLKDKDGRPVTGDEEMADLLNQCFKTCFTREDTSNVPEPDKLTPQNNSKISEFLRERCAKKNKGFEEGGSSRPRWNRAKSLTRTGR